MEENEKLGQGQAFPGAYQYGDENQYTGYYEGLSKRFYAACAAMQGILANQSLSISDNQNEDQFLHWYKEAIAKAAFEFADELLKQENEFND